VIRSGFSVTGNAALGAERSRGFTTGRAHSRHFLTARLSVHDERR
jgi:hypothetical protein